MAGPKTSKFLAQNNYNSFFGLVHGVSGNIKRWLAICVMESSVVKTILDDCSVDTALIQEVKTIYSDFDEFARNTAEEVRRFFCPRTAFDFERLDDFHQFYQRRWSPYDEDVWDGLYADFVMFMTPRVQKIEDFNQQLTIAENIEWVRITSDDSKGYIHLLKEIQNGRKKGSKKLRSLLNENGFEDTMFVNRT